VREGDHYIVNGQKTWTTLAQYWPTGSSVLVRTDTKAKKQEGISFLLIDMKTPGITVRPISMIDGGHEVNEVFFDNVKVPVREPVGQENRAGPAPSSCSATSAPGIARSASPSAASRCVRQIARVEPKQWRPLIETRLRRADRRHRDRGDGAGDHRTARALAMAEGKAQARSGGLDPQDQAARRSSSDQPSSPWKRWASINLRKQPYQIQKNIVAQMILEL
jgi:alkylation response protein AidB-like acyl-CoA dehydrogenase